MVAGCMKKLDLDKSSWDDFKTSFGKVIVYSLGQQRNRVAQDIGTAYRGKYSSASSIACRQNRQNSKESPPPQHISQFFYIALLAVSDAHVPTAAATIAACWGKELSRQFLWIKT